MDKCSIGSCGARVYSSGLCSRHYNRLRTTGTTDDGPRARAPLDVRLWKHVRRRGPNECWPWIGKSRIKGYGIIKLDGTRAKTLAHRAAWMLANGAIPQSDNWHGTVIRHKCNNRLCCNPAHLEPGTQADNVADMWSANGPRGNAKLSERDITAIRSDSRSSRQLAPLYGVSDAHIRSIRNRRCWKEK